MYASMAEWSKAVDLSSILLWRRGFEPHSRHFFPKMWLHCYKIVSFIVTKTYFSRESNSGPTACEAVVITN